MSATRTSSGDTKSGATSLQMPVALTQAKDGRMHILGVSWKGEINLDDPLSRLVFQEWLGRT